MWTNRNSSDYTKRLQDRIRYAAYLQNKESVTTGNAVNLPIDSGSGRNAANSEWTTLQQAPPFISAEEYSTIVGTPSYILPDPTDLVVQSFTDVGITYWTVPRLTRTVEYLLGGGGGGSGPGYDNGGGGGGGAGVVLTGSFGVRGGQQFMITVGDGGTAGTVNRGALPEVSGGDGEASVFGSIQALGGGGGFASRAAGNNSSGGSAPSGSTSTTGGRGGGDTSDGNGAGGGGGGSAGNGAAGVANVGGTGGDGTENALSGTTTTYGTGGTGANGAATANGVAGAANTGNGATGGSGASASQGQGAKGGSGIVILRFYQ